MSYELREIWLNDGTRFVHGNVADDMLATLEEIAGEHHSDTCSFALLGSSCPCDCHKAMAKAAIAKAEGKL